MAQKVTTTARKYVDLDFSFEKHPITGDIAVATGDAAVIKAVRNLICINFYERPFHPEKGSGVPGKLFEPITPISAQAIKSLVEDVITNFEPRVRLVETRVTAFPSDNYFTVTLTFFIRNSTQPTVVTQFLQKVR